MPTPNVPPVDPEHAAAVALALQLDGIIALCLAADVTASILALDARRAGVRQAIDAATFSARQARRRLRQPAGTGPLDPDGPGPGGGS
jgi:hypothetical protein